MGALRKIEHVRSTRTVGYGSAASRLMIMDRMMSRYALYDEAGKHKILEAVTASDVGYSEMRRFVSRFELRGEPTEQHVEAQQSVALLKLGIMPLIVPRQDAVIYATVWLQAAAEAAGSLKEGANPSEVFSFLQTTGPAIRKQLDRIVNDPTRKDIYAALEKQWKQLAQIADKIGQRLEQQMQQRQQQQAQMQQQAAQQNGAMALKARELDGKLLLQDRKTQAALRQKQAKHEQGMAIADSKAASDILLKARAASSTSEE